MAGRGNCRCACGAGGNLAVHLAPGRGPATGHVAVHPAPGKSLLCIRRRRRGPATGQVAVHLPPEDMMLCARRRVGGVPSRDMLLCFRRWGKCCCASGVGGGDQPRDMFLCIWRGGKCYCASGLGAGPAHGRSCCASGAMGGVRVWLARRCRSHALSQPEENAVVAAIRCRSPELQRVGHLEQNVVRIIDIGIYSSSFQPMRVVYSSVVKVPWRPGER